MFENQLVLVIRLQDDRELVEAPQPPHELHTAHQKNRHGYLFATHGVEINILDILSFVFHKGTPLKN